MKRRPKDLKVMEPFDEIWFSVKCPCGAKNWVHDSDINDQTKMDIDQVTCWSCKETFFACEFSAEFNKYDIECAGREEDGQENPS